MDGLAGVSGLVCLNLNLGGNGIFYDKGVKGLEILGKGFSRLQLMKELSFTFDCDYLEKELENFKIITLGLRELKDLDIVSIALFDYNFNSKSEQEVKNQLFEELKTLNLK